MSLPANRRDILYFGNDWFAENRTSSHHIARCLARENRVFYFECPGLRAPQGSTRDLRKLFKKLWRFVRGSETVVLSESRGNRPETTLRVRTLFQIPLHRFGIVRLLNKWLTWLTIRWLMFREGVRQPIAWHMIPHLAGVAGTLQENKLVYYCIDDYCALPGVNMQAVQDMDRKIASRADLVFVASETLLPAKRQINSHTHLSPHGVDVDHFASARDPGPIPPDVAEIPRPIVGFFGLIEKWIDLDLVEYIAKSRPDWSIVMVGRIAVPSHPAMSCPNVHFLGRRDYAQLPAYGRVFDAAIIPYHLTRQVENANPLKLREYLAMGKPVVSVRTPEIEKFADVVSIADEYGEFVQHLDRNLSQPEDPSVASRRIRRVADCSWESRVNQVLKVIDEYPASLPESQEQPLTIPG